MNDRKFLGLLNLYLDGEIDPGSAAGLEREILSDPRRRQVYGEYCRIHRATKLVYERFRTAAAEQGTAGMHALRRNVFTADGLAEVDTTADSISRGPLRTAAYWLGGVAAACAAACAVFLYAPRSTPPGGTTSLVASTPAPKPEQSTAVDATVNTTPIAAPFATEFRLDPFVADRPFARRSPFSFSSGPVSSTFVGLEPAPATTFHLRNGTDNVQTSLRGLSLQATGTSSTDPRVFRQSADGKPVPFEPVGFQIQR